MNETDWEGAGRTLGGFWELLGNISQQFSESPRNSRLLIGILPGANAPRLANVFRGAIFHWQARTPAVGEDADPPNRKPPLAQLLIAN